MAPNILNRTQVLS